MPTKTFGVIGGGSVRSVDIVYPPDPNPALLFLQTVVGNVSRGFNAGPAQFEIKLNVVPFAISSIEAAATMLVYTLKLNVVSKTDANARSLCVDLYGSNGGISTDDYQEAELVGDAAKVLLSALALGVNSIVLSGIPDLRESLLVLRLGISGAQPAGLNDISFSATLEISYHFSPAPVGLTLDGNGNNAIAIDRSLTHLFAWSTGQPGTRLKLWYKRASDAWSGAPQVDQVTSSQFYLAPADTFAAGADNDWQWKVIEYNAEGDPSIESVVKSFSSVGTVDPPTVIPVNPGSPPPPPPPPGVPPTISSTLPLITITGAGVHNRERYQVFEGGVNGFLIYETGELTQATEEHLMIPGFFLNGKTGLENGVPYFFKVFVIAADGSLGAGSTDVNVLFTPPNRPIMLVRFIAAEPWIRIGFLLPRGGAPVNRVQLLVSQDFISATGVGTWTDLFPDVELFPGVNANDLPYRFMEAAHKRTYYFKARAWSGQAFEDSQPVFGFVELGEWLWLHDTANPTTIISFKGWAWGRNSQISRSRQPRKTVGTFLGSANASIDREVTTTGKQVLIETLKVSIFSVVAPGKDSAFLRGQLEALLLAPRLCLRTSEEPLGMIRFGGVVQDTFDSSLDPSAGLFPCSFDLVVTD